MSWFSVWWKKAKPAIETVGKAAIIEKIRAVDLEDNADDLVEQVVDILEGSGGVVSEEQEAALDDLVAQKAEELRSEIIDMIERVQL